MFLNRKQVLLVPPRVLQGGLLGVPPCKRRSLRVCGMLGAKWARSWALWRLRIVTSPPAQSIYAPGGSPPSPQLRCSPLLTRASEPPSHPGQLHLHQWCLPKWLNVSFVQIHIAASRGRPHPHVGRWGNTVPTLLAFFFFFFLIYAKRKMPL